MGFWKALCTCAGCVAGLACIALTGGVATPLVTAVAVGIGGITGHSVGHKIEQDEKKVKNQEKDLALKSETIKTLNQSLEKLQAERNKKQDEHSKQEEENKQLEKELEDAKNKSNNSSLSDEERRKWGAEAMELEEKLNQGKNKSKKLLDEVKGLDKQISDKSKDITSITTSNFKGKKDIWEVLTLENVLIVVAIYALWQIVRDNNRRY